MLRVRTLAAAAAAGITLLGTFVAVAGPSAADPVAPVNTSAPVVSGVFEPGESVTVDPGTWDNLVPDSYEFSFSMLSCSDTDADTCSAVSPASDSPDYVIADGDVDMYLRGQVVVTDLDGIQISDPAVSAPQLVSAAAPAPEAPASQDDPTITFDGPLQPGTTLHAHPGDWDGVQPITFAFGWERCDDDACTPIDGATADSYVVSHADVGSHLILDVIATNAGGDRSAQSDWTELVSAIVPTGPAPVVTGIARVGETLTASVGQWTGTGTLTAAWRWARCEMYNCDEIQGATATTYQVTADDIGRVLVARVDFTDSEGTDGAPSEPTAVVIAAPAASLPGGVTSTGSTITVSGSGFAPDSDVTVVLHSDPVTLGVAHTDANGAFTATFAIPAGTPTGDHHLVLTGVDANGNPVTVVQAVTLTGDAGAATPGTELPRTGTNTFSLVLLAAGLLLLGAVAQLTGRRRARRHA